MAKGTSKMGGGIPRASSFEGKSTDDLLDAVRKKDNESYKDRDNRIKEMFGVPDASEKQVWAIYDIIRGMSENDRGYDANKTPFKIERINVHQINSTITAEEAKLLGMRRTKPPIQVSITTRRDTDNVFLYDTKYHSTIIGPNGSFYTFSKGGKRQTMSRFDVLYGKRGV